MLAYRLCIVSLSLAEIHHGFDSITRTAASNFPFIVDVGIADQTNVLRSDLVVAILLLRVVPLIKLVFRILTRRLQIPARPARKTRKVRIR